MTCPGNQSAPSGNGSPVAVTFAAPVVTGGVAPLQVSCAPASASLFPVGSTTVRCSATDATERTASCTFTVIVSAPLPQLSRTRFLAFGDSMTAGEVTRPAGTATTATGLPNFRFVVVPSAAYPTQLLAQLRARYTAQASQIQVINGGWPGERTEDGALRLPGLLAANRPDAVLLMEGVNDLAALGAPGVQRAAREIDRMAKEVRNRGARLFLATLPPPRDAVRLSQIQSLNSMIRTIAFGEQAVLVDVYQTLSGDLNRFIGPDGVHPNEVGYQRIADVFFAAIRAEFETRTAP
jgi:lysophospholipase L1-like esterase